ncbi:MAG: bifunctional isocitrate dehydrogenase kinase/phosphatase [Lewinellaceae bacterium]|nr:bifunctional isocitrate dehydrogenase kinase/phosphatase [Lewinellaceae bacterium]
MFRKLIPYDAAYLILDAYIQYHHQFKRITKRAKIRFEHRDWVGIQSDSRERIALYRDSVGNTTERILEFLGDRAHDPEVWRLMKEMFLEEIFNFNTRNIAETYYNSIFRHSHKGLSADEELMFVHATGTYREFRSAIPIYHTFYLGQQLENTIHQLFACYPFDAPFADYNRDVGYITETLNRKLREYKRTFRHPRLEMLKSVFYRNKAAYLVGRLYLDDRLHPFILPLLHEDDGIYVDTALLEINDVSSIFSYNRAYFLVDTDIASEMVDFLKIILPSKSLGELYNSIGFEKHGKTVLYRDILRHLDVSADKFIVAPGVKGMVMAVFTLPSYSMVFKMIKDRFQPPKNVTEREVREKYDIVSLHDRVGRMADSHMFENFVFPLDRFSEELIQELRTECPSKIEIEGNQLKIKHLYIEKKMIPLDLYLQDATLEQAEDVINDYGRAIKDMAAVNIFPGDMLLKNFGVTRLERVVFYDYDEIGFLTDYNFRRIPEPRDYDDEWSSEPWYSVGPLDVFPEEFPKFLIGREDVKALFLQRHADLYDVAYWRDVQDRLRRGEIVTVFPYRKRLRFKNAFKAQAAPDTPAIDDKDSEWPTTEDGPAK